MACCKVVKFVKLKNPSFTRKVKLVSSRFCAKYFVNISQTIKDRVTLMVYEDSSHFSVLAEPGLTALELLCSTALASRKTWGCLMERGRLGRGASSGAGNGE